MSRRFLKTTVSPLVLALSLVACSLAPTYQQPEAPVPATYPGQVGEASAQQAALLGWKSFFRDDRLKALIELALEENRDLRLAMQRVEEARAQFGIQDSERLPSIGIGGTGQIQRLPPQLRQGGPDSPSVSRTYQAGVGITAFELDFFGRVKNLSEAAYQQYLASEQASRTVEISLVAQVAEAYFKLRAAEEQLGLLEKTLEARQGTYDIVRTHYDNGIASALDLNQAQSQLDSARAALAETRRQREQAGNALQLVLGTEIPTQLPEAAPFGKDQLLANIPVGLPSDLLIRRPDIISAEHALKGANANIGAARAAFFPQISITGLLGFASPELGHLFGSNRRFWSYSPEITMPIFSGGVTGNLALAEARKNIAVTEYEKAIQTAFREVADALAGEATYEEQLESLRALQKSSSETLDLATLRYENGIDSFLQVQTAQVSLYNAQQQILNTGLASLLNRVELYKALGGGWLAETETANPISEES